jgi:uncharacterized protein YneF (UPF0154 family)
MLPPFMYVIFSVICIILIALGAYFGNKKYKEYKNKNPDPAPAPAPR